MARIVGDTWQSWLQVGATSPSDPAVTALPGGSAAIVIRDMGGAIYYRSYAGKALQGWSGALGVLDTIDAGQKDGALTIGGRVGNAVYFWVGSWTSTSGHSFGANTTTVVAPK